MDEDKRFGPIPNVVAGDCPTNHGETDLAGSLGVVPAEIDTQRLAAALRPYQSRRDGKGYACVSMELQALGERRRCYKRPD